MDIRFRVYLKDILLCSVCVITILYTSCKQNSEINDPETMGVTTLPDSVKWAITTPPDSLNLDPFYEQYVDVNGIPVICSHKVTKQAIYNACNIIDYLTKILPEPVRNEMIRRGARMGIMARYEGTTDIPEHHYLINDTTLNWDVRARGLGGDTICPLSTCAEENLICLVIDKYHAEDITIHEFAHSIHIIGIATIDTGFNALLQKTLDKAIAEGKWINTYASTDIYEYWAEGVQSWFNVNAEVPEPDGKNSPINTRSELKEYDPDLYEILSRYFPETTDQISCHSIPFE